MYTLDRNSWHARLMKFIWSREAHTFTNMCPYFWLTILNIIIFIPFVILNFIVRPIQYASDKVNDRITNAYRKRRDKYREILCNDRPYTESDINEFARLVINESAEIYYISWNDCADISLHNMSQYYDGPSPFLQAVAERLAEKANRKKFNPESLVPYIKKGFTALLWMIGGGLVTLFILYFNQINWGAVLIGLLFLIGTVTIAYLLYVGIVFLARSLSKLIPSLGRVFNYIAIPLTWVGEQITKFFKLIGDMYSNVCPGIKWSDDEE